MYFFIFIVCLNTITSMIKTNFFFDFTDFQVGDGAEDMLNTLKHFDFQFTPRPQGSPNEVVLLEISNVTNLPLRFQVKFPNELDIELEQWADVGEPTELEIRQNSIIDQRLFEFEPRRGELKPGETMVVR